MNRETLLALASRVEQATGPDRELDWAIYEALGSPTFVSSGAVQTWADYYTASIDVALTLANGLGGEVTFFKDGTAKAFLWQPYPLAVEAKAATPALALAAASLRSIAEGNDNDD